MLSEIQPARRDCYRCFKPQVTCICNNLPRVANRTSVLVLQHPREHMHPIGTARFAELGLANSRVEVAWNASARETDAPSWVPEGTALLFPSADARDLRAVPAHERPRHLLVLDGTWHTARTLYREKQWLHALPHYRFLPGAPGRYRIRKEPQLDYVSTIEAIVEALGILEPETQGLPQLIAAFDAMIDAQIAFAADRSGTPRTRAKRRPAAQRRVPHSLVEGFDQLVVVYGEASRPVTGQPREFVYFSACALASGATFECVVQPAVGLPDDCLLDHMGLTSSDLEQAVSPAEFRARWSAFLHDCGAGAAPLMAAWNQRTLDLLALATDTPLSRIALKGAYRAVHGKHAHSLSQIVAQRGLPLEPNQLRGRSAERLASAVAVTRFLHAAAQASDEQG
jgi:DTW domain-containing protein YfiP